jgi:hypothetical protein
MPIVSKNTKTSSATSTTTTTKKTNSRFDCLLDDDDEVVTTNAPKEEYPTLDKKPVTSENAFSKTKHQSKKTTWVASSPPQQPTPTPQPTKQQPAKQPTQTLQHQKVKKNSRDNKKKMLEQMCKNEDNGDKSLRETQTHAPVVTHLPQMQPPEPQYYATGRGGSSLRWVPTSTWYTVEARDCRHPWKLTVTNDRTEKVREIPEEEHIKNVITKLCNNYKRFRNNYIATFGDYAYNEKYISPFYDYNWMLRDDKYRPPIYEKYSPEYLPYKLTNRGIDDVVYYDNDDNRDDNPSGKGDVAQLSDAAYEVVYDVKYEKFNCT